MTRPATLFIAALLAVTLAVLAVGAADAAPPVRGDCATHIAHCGLGEVALCVCSGTAASSCAWVCSKR